MLAKTGRLRIVLIMLSLLLTACQSPSEHPLYTPSSSSPPVTRYHSFDEYLEQTRTSLLGNRYFLTESRSEELEANLPFELKPTTKTEGASRGVLLIHGLGDSPWSFSDIGPELANQGFLVRTVLLPGHGTRPADMIKVSHKEWQQLVRRQIELLKEQVDEVYLGGFSTGGNLAYLAAAEDDAIQGLLLFSPGFKSDEPLAALTPALASLRTWLLTTDPQQVTNYARYSAMPTNGFAQYVRTSSAVMRQLDNHRYNKPVVMVLSEHDSVLDSQKIRTLFQTRFTHPDSRLIWFGTEPSAVKGRIRTIRSYNKALRISTMSHMGLLFSPDNRYYGMHGRERICNNGQSEEGTLSCRRGEAVWYSAWGYQEPDKVHARLTFNPAFDVMIEDIRKVFPAIEHTGDNQLTAKKTP